MGNGSQWIQKKESRLRAKDARSAWTKVTLDNSENGFEFDDGVQAPYDASDIVSVKIVIYNRYGGAEIYVDDIAFVAE